MKTFVVVMIGVWLALKFPVQVGWGFASGIFLMVAITLVSGLLGSKKVVDPFEGRAEKYGNSPEWCYIACSTSTRFHRSYGPFGDREEAERRGPIEARQDQDYFLPRVGEVAARLDQREKEEGEWRRKVRKNRERFIAQQIEYKRRTGKDYPVFGNPALLTAAGIPPDWEPPAAPPVIPNPAIHDIGKDGEIIYHLPPERY
jgi:hypothetical protein